MDNRVSFNPIHHFPFFYSGYDDDNKYSRVLVHFFEVKKKTSERFLHPLGGTGSPSLGCGSMVE